MSPVGQDNQKLIGPPDSDPARMTELRYDASWPEADILPTLSIPNHTVDLEHKGVAAILPCAERYLKANG